MTVLLSLREIPTKSLSQSQRKNRRKQGENEKLDQKELWQSNNLSIVACCHCYHYKNNCTEIPTQFCHNTQWSAYYNSRKYGKHMGDGRK